MYRHIKHSNLRAHKLNALINEFIFNTPARVCAEKLGINKNTVNLWYSRMRDGIYKLPDPPMFSGEVEVDESYFGKRKTGLGRKGTVQGQVPVFGLKELKSGLVIAQVVLNTKTETLLPLIEKYVAKGSTIYSDGHGAYYHLSKLGYKHHVIYHDHTFVTLGNVHTNGIESFWSYTKYMLYNRKGLPYSTYPKHIKEAQMKFNTFETKKLRQLLRKILPF